MRRAGSEEAGAKASAPAMQAAATRSDLEKVIAEEMFRGKMRPFFVTLSSGFVRIAFRESKTMCTLCLFPFRTGVFAFKNNFKILKCRSSAGPAQQREGRPFLWEQGARTMGEAVSKVADPVNCCGARKPDIKDGPNANPKNKTGGGGGMDAIIGGDAFGGLLGRKLLLDPGKLVISDACYKGNLDEVGLAPILCPACSCEEIILPRWCTSAPSSHFA